MNVLDELLEDQSQVDRAYIERRVDDWRRRIVALYDDIKGWLPAGWSMVDGTDVGMHEELMQRHHVPERRLPGKALLHHGQRVGRLEPRGLWIIGANGRVDLRLPDKHFLIVDRSGSFDPSAWRVASIDARRDEKPLNEALILDILA